MNNKEGCKHKVNTCDLWSLRRTITGIFISRWHDLYGLCGETLAKNYNMEPLKPFLCHVGALFWLYFSRGVDRVLWTKPITQRLLPATGPFGPGFVMHGDPWQRSFPLVWWQHYHEKVKKFQSDVHCLLHCTFFQGHWCISLPDDANPPPATSQKYRRNKRVQIQTYPPTKYALKLRISNTMAKNYWLVFLRINENIANRLKKKNCLKVLQVWN